MRLIRGGAVAIALVAGTACAASSPSPTQTPMPTPIVAPPGRILVPPCDDGGACGEGFIVGEHFYGLICVGVDPAAVAHETLATGEGTYAEARVITGLPPGLWLAVRGDLPCLPVQDEPLEHEWYLVQGDATQAQLEEWGDVVGDIVLP
jgi:hypothetical protein